MNKNYTEAYALIEDMAQNHYQWTNERQVCTKSLPLIILLLRLTHSTKNFKKWMLVLSHLLLYHLLVKFVVYLVILVLIAS